MYFTRPPLALQKLYASAVWRMPSAEKKLYLTFDDGPVPDVTTEVLAVLKNNNIPATFFCVGENVKQHPAVYEKIMEGGHAVGNHTQHHLNGWHTHTPAYIKNTLTCSQYVKSNLFRPPYGRIKRNQLKTLSARYKVIMWDVLSGDFDKTLSPADCLNNTKKYTRNGSIIVFHDSLKAKKNVLEVLPAYINHCLQQGYVFEKLG